MTAAPDAGAALLGGVPRLRAVAPPRTAATPPPRRWPGLLLLVIGLGLAVGAIAGGLPTTTAGATKMLDAFGPQLSTESLTRLGSDIDAVAAFGEATRTEAAAGRLRNAPRTAEFAGRSAAIEGNARGLLDSATAARGDVDRLAGIRGLATLPQVLLLVGIGLGVAGAVLLWVRATGPRRWATAAALLAAAVLVIHPFASGLAANAGSAQRVIDRFAPIMTQQQVVTLQQDFLTLVGAVGEIDRGGAVHRTPEIRAFTASWQTVSSDLATLTGAINDNLPDYQRLARTNRLAPTPGGTFALLPWVELALGVAAAGAVLALRRKVGP
ncbi:Integral membrane protein OS=Tsukamurella paurometabola (strain ATCC 8368 / DSM / CCUG 35730/ CIP 100753 / JCM 10117 / KCTC 9821 / NBRC 16120 / NCIMB 702349/ NCTC 13040) OX=521096 GN=Tpau_1604 PE=4 SV=1 [Tsukamurella paurometabola]|uniref:Uncharacterized protein n=1 Tax=Tsukamurella paurometabola (strain ATCC 8368 / DSM 20162 / CCUG 35730 / CIP 100753 / JCM 10117 / KCTC 9821 / NBRC 16120 / NCIMB 702349 / NCTC 13040) TaxID=521096 RepID=D5UYB8_TSUPD|nr:hypothetical protein [Tsukamurella paurometabola]ADG78225.1 conserved hypothetical protein [Tsukamurella paurometabola DSM 20162]SUP30753.1 Uncharacterised protein [Tsukamurella paurometabola]